MTTTPAHIERLEELLERVDISFRAMDLAAKYARKEKRPARARCATKKAELYKFQKSFLEAFKAMVVAAEFTRENYGNVSSHKIKEQLRQALALAKKALEV